MRIAQETFLACVLPHRMRPACQRRFGSRMRPQDRRIVLRCSTSVRSFGSVSLSAASSPPTSASYVVSVRHLVGLGEKMSGGQNPAYSYIFAGFLPTGCYLTAVALAWYTLHCRLHFGIMTFNKENETMYRGLTPHKITPMSGVLHAKPGLRSCFEVTFFVRAR